MYTNFPSVVKSPQLAINRATSSRATSKAVQVSKFFLGGTISSVVGPIGYGMEYTFCFSISALPQRFLRIIYGRCTYKSLEMMKLMIILPIFYMGCFDPPSNKLIYMVISFFAMRISTFVELKELYLAKKCLLIRIS